MPSTRSMLSSCYVRLREEGGLKNVDIECTTHYNIGLAPHVNVTK